MIAEFAHGVYDSFAPFDLFNSSSCARLKFASVRISARYFTFDGSYLRTSAARTVQTSTKLCA